MIRVLYIDDEYLLLDLVKDSLSIPDELIVETTISPQAGLTMLSEGGFDAIICDYQMPLMSGIDLLTKVRASGCDLPFILFTGRGREEVVIEAYRLGADAYVQKGGDAASQFTELEKILRQAVLKYRAEKSSLASEKKFRNIFDRAGDAFFVNALDGSFLEVNEAACVYLGRSKEELLTLNLDDIHSEQLRATRQHWDWLREKAPPLVLEIEHAACAGTRQPSEISISRIELEGRPAVLSIARDISARRAVERSLAESERQLAALMSNLPGMAYRCRNDEDWTMEFVSDGCTDLTGYRPEQLIHNREVGYADLILPEDRAIVWEGVQDGIQGEGPFCLTYRIRTAEGRVRWVWEQGRRGPSPLFENGVLEGLIVDISERMQAQEELGASRLKMALALDLARMASWEYDPATDEYHYDDGFFTIYGAKPSEVPMPISSEHYLREFVLPKDRATVRRLMSERLEGERRDGVVQVEHRVLSRNGEVRHILVRSAVELSLEGEVRRVYGADQDITELKMAEEGMRMANAKLSLLNSITRHDIANQLMVMEGNVRLMQRHLPDRYVMERLEKLQASLQTIQHQINFAKEYQEMGSAAPGWQSLQECVLALPEAKEVGSLQLSAKAARLSIFADPMLPKVFRNLLENSGRYAHRPTAVRIVCREEGGDLLLSYEDEGQGIAPEEKELIFEKGHGKGTGLGLFLSREILAITGIRIVEDGEYGKGARFVLRVPRQCYRFE